MTCATAFLALCIWSMVSQRLPYQQRPMNGRSTRIYLKRMKRPQRGKPPRRVWVLRWSESGGVERFETLGDCREMSRREAESILRSRQGEMDTGAFPRNRPSRLSLAEFRKYATESLEGDLKPATIASYDLAIRQLEQVLGADFPLAEVSVQHVIWLKQAMTTRECSPSSVRTTLASLKTLFNRARTWKMVSENPFSQQPLPRQRSRSKRIFTPAEIDALIDAAPCQWWKAFILLAVTSGLRRQELLHLTWNDLDLEDGMVHVTPKRAGDFLSNNETFPILEWSAKNHQSRSVPIPTRTVESLKTLREQSDGSRYVFLDLVRLRSIGQRQQAGTMRRRFDVSNNLIRDFHVIQRRAAQAIGQADWILGSLHDLRKTFGTGAANVVPMHVLKQLLGHRDITTTAEYYLAADPATAARVRGLFPTAPVVAPTLAIPRSHQLLPGPTASSTL